MRSRLPTIQSMLSIRAFLLLSSLLLGLSGCGSYDPPVLGDHQAETYKTDRETCRKSSTETVRRQNANTPGTWIMSPFTGPPRVRAIMRTCMKSKGYKLDLLSD